MGQIIQLQCTHCDFEKNIYAGGGLKDCELGTILAALPEDGQRTLSSAVRDGANYLSIIRKLCVCDSCGEIYALPIVSYQLKEHTRELYGVCPQCGAAGNRKWDENTSPPCPNCGNEMTQRQTGHWD